MKKNLSYLLFILYTSLFSACENEIPFRSKIQKPQLLMNAFLEAEKEENQVYLHIIDDETTTLVNDGAVTIYVNGEKKEVAEAELISASYNDSTKYCRVKTRFLPGDLVRLEAAAENGQYHAWVEVKIPQPIEKIIRVDTLLTKIKIGYYMDNCIRYRITFNDRPGEKNYYQLRIQENTYRTYPEEGTTYGPEIMYLDIINQEDIVLTDGHLSTADDEEFGILDMTVQNVNNVFTDSRFENGSYTLNVYTRYYDHKNMDEKLLVETDAVIRLLCITQTDYRYMRAMNCLESGNYNETFMEPVIIPQNVVGGLGFVGASSEKQMTIRILTRPPLW